MAEPTVCARLSAVLADQPLFIADGHHRYEAALQYRDEVRAASGVSSGREPHDFVLAHLTNTDEPGLVVLPTHRILQGLPAPVIEDLGGRLAARFPAVERLAGGAPELRAALGSGERGERRAAVCSHTASWLLRWRAKNVEGMAPAVASSSAQRHIDVVLLHHVVLHGILGVDGRVGWRSRSSFSFGPACPRGARPTEAVSRSPAMSGEFTPEERRALEPYVTNVDRSVFALRNLPEVVKGALFARYSGSAKSLRRLFLDEFLDRSEVELERLEAERAQERRRRARD